MKKLRTKISEEYFRRGAHPRECSGPFAFQEYQFRYIRLPPRTFTRFPFARHPLLAPGLFLFNFVCRQTFERPSSWNFLIKERKYIVQRQ